MYEEVIGLTGRKRYRTTLFGKLVLQVEEQGRSFSYDGGGSYSPIYSRWRDASMTDLEPSCFGAMPGAQGKAENDCNRCSHEDRCEGAR